MPVNPLLNYEEEDDLYSQWLTPPGVPASPPFAPRQGNIQAAPPVPSRAAAGMEPTPLMRDTPFIPAAPEGLGSAPDMPRMPRQTISAADPFEGEVARVVDERTKHAASRPKYSDDQYKRPLWQRLAMAAANGAAGYVNAGGRTRVATIGQDAINSRPKYDAAMEDWQNQGAAIDSDLKGILAQDQLRRQKEQDSNRERRDDAYIELQQAHAKHYLKPPTQRPGARYLNTSVGVLDTTTGQIVEGTAPQPRQRTGNRTAEDVLLDPDATPEQIAKAEKMRLQDLAAKGRRGGGGSGASERNAERVDARMRETASRDELSRIEKEEYGDPQNEKSGLHELRSTIGERLANAGEAPQDADVDALNRINNRLRMIYKRKLEMGVIDRAEHDSMVAGLQDASKTKYMGSGNTAKPRTTTAPSVKPVRKYNPKTRKIE